MAVQFTSAAMVSLHGVIEACLAGGDSGSIGRMWVVGDEIVPIFDLMFR